MRALLDGIVDVSREAELRIRGLSMDSRTLVPGDLFLACRGIASHGASHLAQALERGAAASLVEPPLPDGALINWPGLPVFAVPGLSIQAGVLADRFFGEPSRDLRVTGVTGTNGKTTVTHLLAYALSALQGRPRVCGLLGTLGYGFPGHLQPGAHTTPDAVTLHRFLREAHAQGADDAVMEVSSHALNQGRVSGVRFTLAVYTNLGRDHLDYHGDMAGYAAAKRTLFNAPGLQQAVLNMDDCHGQRWARELDGALEVYGYGLHSMPLAGVPCLRGQVLSSGADGLALQLAGPWGMARLQSTLVGRLNASNLLAATTALLAMGYRLDSVCEALADTLVVPGRMEIFRAPGQPLVAVDYAHTPDALQAALADLRELVSGAIYCVFGCGGERDPGKRPLMGAVAAERADHVLLTDDNPRSESSAAILEQIRAGCRGSARIHVVPDRRQAITLALTEAGPDDGVLVAGKGHEGSQQIGSGRVPFDDRAVVQGLLS